MTAHTPTRTTRGARAWAPLLDLVCLTTFVLAGAGQHDVDQGIGWFLTVLWPLVGAWFACALLTRLYTSSDRMWLRLTITLGAAALLNAVLRGAFTDRPFVSVYTLVFVAWMVLTAYGWRAITRVRSVRRERLQRPDRGIAPSA